MKGMNPVSEVKRMMKRMFEEVKENIQKQLNESQENAYFKKIEKTQKQLNELKEDLNKHWNNQENYF
jgi:dephospho-CoA kinase